MAQVLVCRNCKVETIHSHMHDTAHGIPDTHMAGSEHYVCELCGLMTFAKDKIEGFKFILDKA